MIRSVLAALLGGSAEGDLKPAEVYANPFGALCHLLEGWRPPEEGMLASTPKDTPEYGLTVFGRVVASASAFSELKAWAETVAEDAAAYRGLPPSEVRFLRDVAGVVREAGSYKALHEWARKQAEAE
jgi:hypothetical protein